MRTYKVTEVAAMFNVDKTVVYKWIRRGDMACVACGPKSTRVTDEQIQEFIANATVPAARSRR